MVDLGAETFQCWYGAHQRPVAERSVEHIWPNAFGGSHSPDWFKTHDVCKRCNNLIGQFVDAEFVRTFFGTSLRLTAHLPFIDVNNPKPMPLIYMGKQSVGPGEAEVCETWVGPRGEAIYFFHCVDRIDFDGYAAGDPIRRHKDPGRVYFGLTRPNSFWLYLAIASIKAKFEGAEIRSLTKFSDASFAKQFAPETTQSELDRTYVRPLWIERYQKVHQVLSMDYGARLQAKLALGFGHALFGSEFAKQPYADTLRQGLWHRTSSGKDLPHLIGKSFWLPDDKLFNANFTHNGAFTLLFSRSYEGAWVSAFLSGKSMHTLMLPRNQILASPFFDRFTNNFVVLLYPALNQFVGPLPAVTYTMHRRGHLIPQLSEIEARCRTIEQIEDEAAKYDIAADEAA
jgi:HNH endonuclease